MTWGYTLGDHYTVREKREYPWPCEQEPNRLFELWPGDVLTKHPDGSMTKQNGLGMTNLLVPEGDLVLVGFNGYMVVGA